MRFFRKKNITKVTK